MTVTAPIQAHELPAPVTPWASAPPAPPCPAAGGAGRSRRLRLVSHSAPQDTAAAPAVRPPPVAALQRLALYAFEVIEGTRVVSQLAGTITPDVARDLQKRRAMRTERRTLCRDQRRIMAIPGPAHISRAAAGVIEAAVVLHARERSCAVALRLELRGPRWRVTSLTVL